MQPSNYGLIFLSCQLFFNFGLAVYVFISNRQAAKDKELQETKERLSRLEERVSNMPDHQVISDMAGDMKALKESVAGLKEVIAPLAKAVDRVNDYLLHHKD
jgi:predicted  nucleic acid-binding Zn-ribbon protein